MPVCVLLCVTLQVVLLYVAFKLCVALCCMQAVCCFLSHAVCMLLLLFKAFMQCVALFPMPVCRSVAFLSVLLSDSLKNDQQYIILVPTDAPL